MRRRGFTFLELLVALSLFAVGLIGILQIFPLNRRFLAQSAMTTQAAFLAQEGMEELRSLPYSSLTVGTYQPLTQVSTVSGDPASLFSREVTVELVDDNYGTSNADVGLKVVNVRVTWSERGISRQYTISTVVSNV